MYFDKRNFYGCKRIAQRNAGVRICCRIYDDEIGLILACRLYTVDEFAFVIALEGDAMRPAFCCQACKMLIDICQCLPSVDIWLACAEQIRSEEHTSELQSLMRISYAVFCLKKKNI